MIGITQSLTSDQLFYKIGRKWKLRYCVLSKKTKVAAMLRLYIFKTEAEYREAQRNRNEPSPDSAIVDNVYGFMAGTHMDNRKWVTRLICESSVHCVAFNSYSENEKWTSILQNYLCDTYFHVRLLRADKRSKLHHNQEGCLHIQQHRICFVSEPSGSPVAHPKLLLEWSMHQIRAYGQLDPSDLETIGSKNSSSANGGMSTSSETSVRFALEGIPQCEKGSGIFVFACSQTEELYNRVHDAISKRLPDPTLNSESDRSDLISEYTSPPSRCLSRMDSAPSAYYPTNRSNISFGQMTRQSRNSRSFIDRSFQENDQWASYIEADILARELASRSMSVDQNQGSYNQNQPFRTSSHHSQAPLSPTNLNNLDYEPTSPRYSSHFHNTRPTNIVQPDHEEIVMRKNEHSHLNDRAKMESYAGNHEYIRMKHSSELLDTVGLSDNKSSFDDRSKPTTPHSRSRHNTGVKFSFDNQDSDHQVLFPEEDINKDKPWMDHFLTMERKQTSITTSDKMAAYQSGQQYFTQQQPNSGDSNPSKSSKRTSRFLRTYSLNTKRDKNRRDASEKRGFLQRLLRRQSAKEESSNQIYVNNSHESDKWLPLDDNPPISPDGRPRFHQSESIAKSTSATTSHSYYNESAQCELSEYIAMNSETLSNSPDANSHHSTNNENVPPLQSIQQPHNSEYVNIPNSQLSTVILPKLSDAPVHNSSLLARRRLRALGGNFNPLSPIMDVTDGSQQQYESSQLSQSMPQARLQTFADAAAATEQGPNQGRFRWKEFALMHSLDRKRASFSSTTGGHAPIGNLSSSLLTSKDYESMPTTPGASMTDPFVSARRVNPANLNASEPASKSNGPMVVIPWNFFSNSSSPRSPPVDNKFRPLSSDCELDYLSDRGVWQFKNAHYNKLDESSDDVFEQREYENWSNIQPRQRAASERPPINSINGDCGKLPCLNCNHVFNQPYVCLFDKSMPGESAQPQLGFCSHSFCHQMHLPTVNEPDYSTVSSQKPRSGCEYVDKRKIRCAALPDKSQEELFSSSCAGVAVNNQVNRESFTQHYMNIPPGGFGQQNRDVSIDAALSLLNEINLSHHYMNLEALESPPAPSSPPNRQSVPYVNLQEFPPNKIDPNSLPLEVREPRVNYAPVDMRNYSTSSANSSTKCKSDSSPKSTTSQLSYATLVMPHKNKDSHLLSASQYRPNLERESGGRNDDAVMELTSTNTPDTISPQLNYAEIDFKQTEALSQLYSDYEPTDQIRASPVFDAGETLSTFSSSNANKRRQKPLKSIIKV